MAKAKNSKQVLKRLFECDDCHHQQFVSFVELNRAAKPRCYRCGCTRLELVSEEAKDDQRRLNGERIIHTCGSKLLARNADNRHHIIS